MMKEEHHLVSGEWFIPLGWKRGDLSDLLAEKSLAVADTDALLMQCRSLENQLPAGDYDALLKKFLNLAYVAKLWQALLDVFVYYTKYFELQDEGQANLLEGALTRLLRLEEEARKALGESFYVWQLSHNPNASYTTAKEPVQSFVRDVRESFRLEKALHAKLIAENLTDFVICGGGFEGHKLLKEVNFSDTYLKPDGICRIPSTYRGKSFSTVNAHGWFSYELMVRPGVPNTLVVAANGSDGHIDFDLTIGDVKHEVRAASPEKAEFTFSFNPGSAETIRVRVDRVTGYTPFIYEIRVL